MMEAYKKLQGLNHSLIKKIQRYYKDHPHDWYIRLHRAIGKDEDRKGEAMLIGTMVHKAFEVGPEFLDQIYCIADLKMNAKEYAVINSSEPLPIAYAKAFKSKSSEEVIRISKKHSQDVTLAETKVWNTVKRKAQAIRNKYDNALMNNGLSSDSVLIEHYIAQFKSITLSGEELIEKIKQCYAILASTVNYWFGGFIDNPNFEIYNEYIVSVPFTTINREGLKAINNAIDSVKEKIQEPVLLKGILDKLMINHTDKIIVVVDYKCYSGTIVEKVCEFDYDRQLGFYKFILTLLYPEYTIYTYICAINTNSYRTEVFETNALDEVLGVRWFPIDSPDKTVDLYRTLFEWETSFDLNNQGIESLKSCSDQNPAMKFVWQRHNPYTRLTILKSIELYNEYLEFTKQNEDGNKQKQFGA
jgi:hypothetical protein